MEKTPLLPVGKSTHHYDERTIPISISIITMAQSGSGCKLMIRVGCIPCVEKKKKKNHPKKSHDHVITKPISRAYISSEDGKDPL